MSQDILYGIENITGLIVGKKILLVKDQAYDFLPIKELLNATNHVDFAEFTPNPLYEQVCKGVELFKREACEAIVAVGGGSTMDVAKCIKLYSGMDPSINYLQQEMKDTGIPLIAIPTTAGTGSESTRHAVIYFQGEKQSVSHESIVPNVAILEPGVLKTLPLYQKKCTMLDALCQAIESWWSVNSNEESIGYSKKAITGIAAYWKVYCVDNTDEAALRIMEAANYAGRAINITATTAAHAMSYKITSLYKLPHGHAVAVCMEKVWDYILKHTEACIDPRGVQDLQNRLQEISQLFCLEQFEEMLKELDIHGPVCEDGDHDLPILVTSVNPIRLKNNPVALQESVLREMYERILQ